MQQRQKPNGLRSKGVRRKKVLSVTEGLASLFAEKAGEELEQLVSLWDTWEDVMGPSVTMLGAPLGHKKKTLIIGVDDSMALQELKMQSTEILSLANQHLGTPFFTDLSIVLKGQRTTLSGKKKPSVKKHATAPKALPAPPPDFGSLLPRLDPQSPVTSCYKAFMKMYGLKA